MNIKEKKVSIYNRSLKSLEILVNRSVFSDDNYFLFIYKKTEKLLTALYMVTNLFVDNDPVKWEVRTLGLGLLSSSLSLRDKSTVEGKEIIIDTISKAVEIISLLEVASIAGLISEMNLTILKKELLFMVDTLDSLKKSSYSGEKFVLPDSLFDVSGYLRDTREADEPGNETPSKRRGSGLRGGEREVKEPGSFKTVPDDKGQDKGQVIKDNKGDTSIKRTTSTDTSYVSNNQKDIRKNLIINFLRKRGKMSVADFCEVITDCGAKTIQRIVNELVADNMVIRFGKKRWSTYSLISQ